MFLSRFLKYVLTANLFMITSIGSSIASERDLYSFTWLDKDKEVYVLQNRVYRKDGHLHVNLSGGVTTSGAFITSKNLQARLGFFFREEWGIEGIYSLNSGKENVTAQDVRNRGGSGSVPFRRIVDNYMGALVLWSPFYSKVNMFNQVFYMDWMLGVGFASLSETNNKPEFLNSATNPKFSSEKHSGLIWETSMKFYLSQNWEIRTDLTAVHYKAVKASTSETVFYSNWDFGIGMGYSF